MSNVTYICSFLALLDVIPLLANCNGDLLQDLSTVAYSGRYNMVVLTIHCDVYPAAIVECVVLLVQHKHLTLIPSLVL